MGVEGEMEAWEGTGVEPACVSGLLQRRPRPAPSASRRCTCCNCRRCYCCCCWPLCQAPWRIRERTCPAAITPGRMVMLDAACRQSVCTVQNEALEYHTQWAHAYPCCSCAACSNQCNARWRHSLHVGPNRTLPMRGTHLLWHGRVAGEGSASHIVRSCRSTNSTLCRVSSKHQSESRMTLNMRVGHCRVQCSAQRHAAARTQPPCTCGRSAVSSATHE